MVNIKDLAGICLQFGKHSEGLMSLLNQCAKNGGEREIGFIAVNGMRLLEEHQAKVHKIGSLIAWAISAPFFMLALTQLVSLLKTLGII